MKMLESDMGWKLNEEKATQKVECNDGPENNSRPENSLVLDTETNP